MSEAPPAHPLSSPEPDGTTRRWFLAGGLAVVLGAGGGAIVELVRNPKHRPALPPPAPGALLAAVESERVLIADLDATTGGPPAVRRVVVAARADHAAHLHALSALVARYRRVAPGQRRRHRGSPRTLAQLRAAEQHAAVVAARRARALEGGSAALLASIAACEATHAELLR
jgi:hypothetical protein